MLASLIAVLFEYLSLKKQHKYREIMFSASLFTIGLVLGAIQYFNVKVPSPLIIIIRIFKPISQYVTRLLVE
jgi:hypothetical protein